MPDIMKRLGREMLVLDGAMGTMLQRAGLPSGECPELLNVTEPEIVGQVLDYYKMAGSDCAITNTFGGSAPKLAEYGLEDRVAEINAAAVRIAKQFGAPHVLADMGPTGLVMQPLGTATFEEVFSAFAEQAAALASEGPDAILIETMTDIAEARCAVLAARSVTDLPVFASVTFGLGGVTDLSGTPPEAAAVILEAAGASAVGLNCGLGPEQMLPLLQRMAAATALPVIAQPNAGLPRLENGVTVFPGTADEMGAFAASAIEAGAAAVGSCCGSSPSFTGAIADALSGRDCATISRGFSGCVLAGPRRAVEIGQGQPLRVVGERINPTGKPALKESLLAGSMSVVRSFASEQQQSGADLLDVNVGAAGVDAVSALQSAVLALIGTSDLPLVLDTTDAAALEAALRIYPGKALINSVNGGTESMAAVIPLAAQYGSALVVLALDDDGIPEDEAGRMGIVRRVRERARLRGIADKDLLVDALVMTAATDAAAAAVTAATVGAAHKEGLSTILGISNISHGLPDRALLNAAFVGITAAEGLDAAIANPDDHVVMEAIKTASQARLSGEPADPEAAWRAWESAYDTAIAKAREGIEVDVGATAAAQDPKQALEGAVLRGDADASPELVDRVVASGVSAELVIAEVLTPAIQRLGDAFGRGEVFLPQLMVSAEAMKAAVARVKELLPAGGTSAGRVAFATVKGDIHSIGKDICVSLLESQGYEVADLGVDVDLDKVVSAAEQADVVCLSALMTTTLPAMQQAVEAVRDRTGKPVLVGGAVVTAEWAASVGAGHAADALGCVEAVRGAVNA